ncbi:Mg2 transporter protein CorA family protein [Desulfovibrio sp. X2]|uniref:magnesium transporter CorA family protein n=1 Tax=Desulfovibrio sp. X2 TaxID=941449 RepID=UPI0003588D13|nr:magnesium transporter CorA family protein [Desulfovibrio sp. X2]EPR43955.1 Mg2 transporter protein CorA family protein [Desulfovibrio sp. X2]
MITMYAEREGRWLAGNVEADKPFALPDGAVWLDMSSPTEEEKRLVGAALGIEIPSRAEMEEIEVSSRLYQEDGASFMTASILSRVEQHHIDASAITFILAGKCLVTVRFTEPKPFAAHAARLLKAGAHCDSSPDILLGLLETIVDRLADLLELSAAAVDALSHRVFRSRPGDGREDVDLTATLKDIGIEGDHASKIRESLVSIGRMGMFLGQATNGHMTCADFRDRLFVLTRDVGSLSDHAGFVANKINFLLDATLGMINIEQNAIIKIFSVVAVVFLPPTLIASIYGMNFKHMPELSSEFGYPLAIVLMVLSAILPYVFFKRKKWL